jgi:hypothetical protein
VAVPGWFFEADGHLECGVLVFAGPGQVHVDHTGAAHGTLGVADSSQHPFDDVDVMLTTIEVTNAD